MKVSFMVLLLCASTILGLSPNGSRDETFNPEALIRRLTPKRRELRYSQLVDMMEKYNPEFDARKYWSYGCNCLVLGDRPMSDPGFGPPIDALDAVCKQYKDCLKCARETHGEQCIGEFVRYRYGYKDGEAVCKSGPHTCERDLCECDAMFARNHVAKKNVFDEKYHMFWSNGVWEPWAEGSCPRGAGGVFDPQCCRPDDGTGPAFLFNAASKACCPDGRIVRDAGQC